METQARVCTTVISGPHSPLKNQVKACGRRRCGTSYLCGKGGVVLEQCVEQVGLLVRGPPSHRVLGPALTQYLHGHLHYQHRLETADFRNCCTETGWVRTHRTLPCLSSVTRASAGSVSDEAAVSSGKKGGKPGLCSQHDSNSNPGLQRHGAKASKKTQGSEQIMIESGIQGLSACIMTQLSTCRRRPAV